MTGDAVAVAPLARPPDATVVLPGSKSITVRALLAATLAEGTSTLTGALVAEDTAAAVRAVEALGARVVADPTGTTLVVHGVGPTLAPGPARLEVGQSGATARLALALLGLGPGPYTVDGDEQLRRRPMGPGLDALRQLGAAVHEAGEPGALPLVVAGGPVRGGLVHVPGDVSSQFLSGLLLAGACCRVGIELDVTTPLVSTPYLEMTRAVMRAFGVEVDGLAVRPGTYRPTAYAIEPDASAASYFFAAAAITGGRVRVPGLHRASLQGDVGFVDVLERMGAEVRWSDDAVEVRGTGGLHGIDVDLADVSDTAPTLAAVAAFAEGTTRVTGIGFIRRKESDRIAAAVAELRRAGVDADEEADGFVVHGRGAAGPHGARFATWGDHRMAMAFALLGLVVPGVEIEDPGCVAKSFPTYFAVLDGLR